MHLKNTQGAKNVLKQLILFACLATTLVTKAFCDQDGSGPEVGKIVPPLDGRTLSGDLYLLRKDVGRPKVINFFWVECHPCSEEMPEMARLEKRFSGVKFISVHTSLNAASVEEVKVAEFIKKLKAAPSNIVLSTNRELGSIFNIQALPHTMVLDGNNKVLINITGYNADTIKALESTLDGL